MVLTIRLVRRIVIRRCAQSAIGTRRMGKHWTRTILAVLAATLVAFATVDARAAVVFSQSDLGGLAGSGAALIEDSSYAEIAHDTMLELLSDDFQFYDPMAKQPASPDVSPVLTPLSDMSPPPSHMVGGVGGVGGYALAGEATIPTSADIQASLAPEARQILPTGPPYRWFRPPRADFCQS